jgi:hypothetical protein
MHAGAQRTAVPEEAAGPRRQLVRVVSMNKVYLFADVSRIWLQAV